MSTKALDRGRAALRVRLLALALFIAWSGATSAEPLRVLGLPVEDPVTRSTVERPTLVRALAPVEFTATHQMTEWLLDRPPLAATLARHLHPPLERYSIVSRGPGQYEVDDQGALRGELRLVGQASDRRIYICHGEFRSLRNLLAFSGSMVFTLEYRQRREGKDPQMEVSPQIYVRLDNPFIHGVVRALRPLLSGVIDRRAAGLTAATQIVTDRITRDPAGLYQEMGTWADVTADEREEFRIAFLATGSLR
ncbi:MAG TPA: hypothetical protein VMG58_04925 [Candidatus Sulfotelmatobacter sp.]|nr:hypothetical protein [Candidatus Sulfotelmatobacter sp.]